MVDVCVKDVGWQEKCNGRVREREGERESNCRAFVLLVEQFFSFTFQGEGDSGSVEANGGLAE